MTNARTPSQPRSSDRHCQTAFIPKCTPAPGRRIKPWFVAQAMEHTAQDARRSFIKICYGNAPPANVWNILKKEGWRIVKVKVTEL